MNKVILSQALTPTVGEGAETGFGSWIKRLLEHNGHHLRAFYECLW